MIEAIKEGAMAFIVDGNEGVGAVRKVKKDKLVIYVENSGDFEVPKSAVAAVHSQKVMLDPKLLDHDFLKAIGHAHDREDPELQG